MKKLLLFLFFSLPFIGLIAQDVVLNELSGDAGQTDGSNDGIVELAGPSGTDIGCWVVSNGEWAFTFPAGTTIPASGLVLIYCAEDAVNFIGGVGILGASNGLACDECDFPNLDQNPDFVSNGGDVLDFNVCDAANAAYYDPAATGFTLDNSSSTDGDNVVLFSDDIINFGGNDYYEIQDAVYWAGGPSGAADNVASSNGDGMGYTLGTSGIRGDGGSGSGVPAVPNSTACGFTASHYMPDYIGDTNYTSDVWTNIGDNQKGCNSSYVRATIPGSNVTGAVLDSETALVGSGPDGTTTATAMAQWTTTDHPNPGYSNDTQAWGFTVDNTTSCAPLAITFTLEVYNYQNVSDELDVYSGVDNLQIGSYILAPATDPNAAPGVEGVQTWASHAEDAATGITTMTYITGILPTGSHNFTLQWDDYSNCCGSGSITSSNECYEREDISVTIYEPLVIIGDGNIDCSAGDAAAGLINASSFVSGGESLSYSLYSDSPATTLVSTNSTGVFELLSDGAIPSPVYTIIITDGSPCAFTAVELTVEDNCEAPPICPSALENTGTEANGAVCPGSTIDLCLNGTDLPLGGQICWYQVPASGDAPNASIDPLLGCVTIPTASTPPTPTGGPVLNEVLYDPSGNDGTGTTTCEALEIAGAPNTDLSCYMLTDGDWTIVIPDGTVIPADGYFVIGSGGCNDSDMMNNADVDLNPFTCGCATTTSTNLLNFTNGGEFVGLLDPSGNTVDGLIFEEDVTGDSNSPDGQNQTPTNPMGCTNAAFTIETIDAKNPFDATQGSGNWDKITGDGAAANTSAIRVTDVTGIWDVAAAPSIGSSNIATSTPVPPCLSLTFDESYCSGDIFINSLIVGVPSTCPAGSDVGISSDYSMACPEADLVPLAVDRCEASPGPDSGEDITVNLTGGSGTYDLVYDINGTQTTVLGVTNPYLINIPAPTAGEQEVTLVSVTDAGGTMCLGSIDSDAAVINIVAAASNAIVSASTDITSCAAPDGSVTITFSGSTGPFEFEYTIDGGPPIATTVEGTTYTISPISEPGTYALASIAVDGCPGTFSGSESVGTIASAPVIAAISDGCLGADSDAFITVTPAAIATYTVDIIYNTATASGLTYSGSVTTDATGLMTIDGSLVDGAIEFTSVSVVDAAGCISTPSTATFPCALPVELMDFKAIKKDETSLLSWKTASEENNDYFAIEHSLNGVDFREIGIIQGAGNSTEINTYQFIHTSPNNGSNYYRLRIVDFSGKAEYSSVEVLEFGHANLNISIRPNVSKNNVTLISNIEFNSDVKIEVVNSAGQLMQMLRLPEGAQQLDINIAELAAGNYFVKVTDQNKTYNSRFIKID